MNQVFYRKWRPQRLDQVVGQDSVTQTLRQAIVLGRVAHAYLLCGPRGTGKTSTARILAKAVNCLSPQDGEPDNMCVVCQSINEGRALDLIEIDAASNRGIDDIRDLSEKIRFTPNEAQHKIYIIDEVHMLTEPAFNALLKTLEEPPKHAMLILATTEPEKVPLTIISRCQRFDFRRISSELMVGKLTDLCLNEGIEAAPSALKLISRASSGSLRDAENLLEQVLLSCGSPITEDHVRDLLGFVSDEIALVLVGCIVNKAVQGGLTAINQVADEGGDLSQLHRSAMEYLRGILLIKANAGTGLDSSEETITQLQALANQTSLDHLVQIMKTFSKVDMRRESSSPLPLELALLESSTQGPAGDLSSQPLMADIKQDLNNKTSPPEATSPVSPTPPALGRPPTIPNNAPAAESDPGIASTPLARLETQWPQIIKSLRHTGHRFNLGALLRSCKEREVIDNRIMLKFPYRSHVERVKEELSNPTTARKVQEVFAEFMDSSYLVQVALSNANLASERRDTAERSHLVQIAQAMGAQVVDDKEEQA